MGGSSNFEVSAPKVSVPFGHLHDGNSWLRALIAATNCKVIKFIKKQRKYATTHNTTLQRHWRASCERQCKFHFVGRLTLLLPWLWLFSSHSAKVTRSILKTMQGCPSILQNLIQLHASASCKFFADAG